MLDNPETEPPLPADQPDPPRSLCGGILPGVFAILLISMGVGFAANSIREDGSINLKRNYFNKEAVSSVSGTSEQDPGDTGAAADVDSGDSPVIAEDPDDGIQRLNFEEAQDNFITGEEEFEASGESIYLFVDARVRDQYEDGHIPGAIWLYHYESENLIDEVRSELEMAFFIIVYCNGGDCEDSLHLSVDLMSLYNLPPENIYVYEGGLDEWKERGMPVTVGSERR